MAEPSSDARDAVHALARIARMLERRLPGGLSLADFRMLSAVDGGEARASRLAQRLAIGKPAVSGSVDSLVRRGLLTRTTHDRDQRAVDLALTSAGERVLREAETTLAELVVEIADGTADPVTTLAALAGFGDALERRQADVAASRSARATA